MDRAVILWVWTAGRVATNLAVAAVGLAIFATFFGASFWIVAWALAALMVSGTFSWFFYQIANVGELESQPEPARS